MEPKENLDRQRVLGLLKSSTGLAFRGFDVQRLTAPCVYMWLRGQDVIYIGFSRRGAERSLSCRHKTVKCEPDDTLWIWPMKTVEDAKTLEALLIHALKPLFNQTNGYAVLLVAGRLGLTYGRAAEWIGARGSVKVNPERLHRALAK